MSIIFFFNDTATTEIYTLSLHDALPISEDRRHEREVEVLQSRAEIPEPGEDREAEVDGDAEGERQDRSEEHTSELQSRQYLVCRLLLEKKKTTSSCNIYQTVIIDIEYST